MFEVVEFNLAGQWHTPTLGRLAEVLVFYDRVHLRAPLGRLAQLIPTDLDDLTLFRRLVEDNRIAITIDQLPLGEVAAELGLFQNPMGMRANPEGVRERFREAYPAVRPPPLSMQANPDKAYGTAWLSDWERIMARAVDPFQTVTDYPGQLIANAEAKMKLIAEPTFLKSALEAYGATASPDTRALLQNVVPIEVEFEGRAVVGLDAPGMGTPAEMLEFLSQADDLLEGVDGSKARDTYTSPDFDRWSRTLVRDSLVRLGARDDIAAFQTDVLGNSSIAAAIDGGAKAFRDIEPVLAAREDFAKVVRGRPVDATLAKTYFEEINKTSWLTHGPGRAVRFVAFNVPAVAVFAAGAALTPLTGVAVGVAFNAIDYFVVDRLIKGNACRSFVDGKLKPFVSGP